jgi:phosphatidylglycerophosphate synthase
VDGRHEIATEICPPARSGSEDARVCRVTGRTSSTCEMNRIVAHPVPLGRADRHGAAVLTLRQGLLTGLTAHVALLGALAGTVGLGVAGGLVGLAYGVAVVGLLSRALQRSGAAALGPADLITSVRSALVGGIAALVADSFVRPVPVGTLTALAVVALVLDGVDGRVARHTGTASAVGARFDMEVDSVVVLLLSAHVARWLGLWVLAIGSVRYVLLVARWALPWLRRPVPPRHWCKVVAAVQGIVLATAAAGVLFRLVAVLALVVVAALLAESFGREVWWLWRRHRAGIEGDVEPSAVGSAHG